VVLAKTSKALARMNEAFKARDVQKTYWAVVQNLPQPSAGKLEHWLWRNTKKNVTRAFDNERKDTQKAELEYSTLDSHQGYHLLEIKPITGRTHQIRSQLSAIQCPIMGDVKYGFQQANEDRSIHLHARSLSFAHPTKGERIEIKAQVPKTGIWMAFEKRQ
jgi:23S rRNA pseudouridine1911/1915/1917 synthase